MAQSQFGSEPPRDPYEVLGVSRGASLADIKKAYARKIKEHPPGERPREFQSIQSAFERLRRGANAAEESKVSAPVVAVELWPKVLEPDPDEFARGVEARLQEHGAEATLTWLLEQSEQSPRDGRCYIHGFRVAIEAGRPIDFALGIWQRGIEQRAPVAASIVGSLTGSELTQLVARADFSWSQLCHQDTEDAAIVLWTRSMEQRLEAGAEEAAMAELESAEVLQAVRREGPLLQHVINYARVLLWRFPQRVERLAGQLPAKVLSEVPLLPEVGLAARLAQQSVPQALTDYVKWSHYAASWNLHVSARLALALKQRDGTCLRKLLELCDGDVDLPELLGARARLMIEKAPEPDEQEAARQRALQQLLLEHSKQLTQGLAMRLNDLVVLGIVVLGVLSLFYFGGRVVSGELSFLQGLVRGVGSCFGLLLLLGWLSNWSDDRQKQRYKAVIRADLLLALSQAGYFPEEVARAALVVPGSTTPIEKNLQTFLAGEPLLHFLTTVQLLSRHASNPGAPTPEVEEPELSPDKARGLEEFKLLLALPDDQLLAEAERYLERTSAARDWKRYELGASVFADALGVRSLMSWSRAQPQSAHRLLLLALARLQWAWRGKRWLADVATEEMGQRILHHRYQLCGLGLLSAAQLAPDNPLPWAYLIRVGRNLGLGRAQVQRWYEEALRRAPEAWVAHAEMAMTLSERCLGTHAELAELARERAHQAAGTALEALLALAALYQLIDGVRNDEETAPWVISTAEVRAALGRCQTHLATARDPSALYAWNAFACYAFAAGDRELLGGCLPGALRNPSEDPWYLLGMPKTMLQRAQQFLREPAST